MAAAIVLCTLVIAGCSQAVGREEFIHREVDVLEQLAGVLAGASAAGTVFIGQAVIEDRHEQLAVPLQTYNRKLAQGHKGPAAVVSHSQVAAKALADTGRNLADVAVTAAVLAALHQLGIQNNGVHSLHNPHQIGKFQRVSIPSNFFKMILTFPSRFTLIWSMIFRKSRFVTVSKFKKRSISRI